MARKIYTDISLMGGSSVQKLRCENLASAPTSPVAGQVYYSTVDNNFYGWNGTAWINLSQIITNAITIKGEITNANTSPAFPASPTVGDTWFVTTNVGLVGTISVEVGDQLVYGVSGWFCLQRNLQQATVSIAGFIQLATQAEVNASSDNTKAITPQTLAGFLSNYLYQKKVVTLIASLVANTLTTVTHGLALITQNDCSVSIWQGGELIDLDVVSSSVNAIQVKSNVALANVTIVVQG